MIDQLSLFTERTPEELQAEQDRASLRGALGGGAWQTRSEICRYLNWPERKLREVAEGMGAEIVRCQLGFKLTTLITRDDLPDVQQAIDAFHSQAKKMDTYAHSLRRRLHALIG